MVFLYFLAAIGGCGNDFSTGESLVSGVSQFLFVGSTDSDLRMLLGKAQYVSTSTKPGQTANQSEPEIQNWYYDMLNNPLHLHFVNHICRVANFDDTDEDRQLEELTARNIAEFVSGRHDLEIRAILGAPEVEEIFDPKDPGKPRQLLFYHAGFGRCVELTFENNMCVDARLGIIWH